MRFDETSKRPGIHREIVPGLNSFVIDFVSGDFSYLLRVLSDFATNATKVTYTYVSDFRNEYELLTTASCQ